MIKQNEFIAALNVAASFAAADKPGLHVVHFNFTWENRVELVGTDGQRMVILELEVNHTVPVGGRFSIPLQMIDQIKEKFPVIKDGPEPLLSLAAWDGALMIAGADVFTGSGPNPAEFPPYQDIIAGLNPEKLAISLNPKFVGSIMKDCTPLCENKKPIFPEVTIYLNGYNRPASFDFKIRTELPAIKKCIAYLMPYKQQ